jgi:integrase
MAKLVRDEKVPNLYLDSRSGIYQYRKSITVDGRPKEVFKSLKTRNRNEAISRINQLLTKLPDFLGRKKRPTMNEIYIDLIDVYQGQAKKTFVDFEGICRMHILPYIGNLDPRDVKGNWEDFKARVKLAKPGMSLRHVRKHTVRLLSAAADKNFIDGIPELLLTAAEKGGGRPRSYEDHEVQKVFFDEIDPKKHKFRARTLSKMRLQHKLVLFCGLRPPSEIINLEWSFFDFDRGVLRLPKDFIKTREARVVPVPPEVIKDLLEWKENRTKQMAKSPYLFPNRYDPKRPANPSDHSWQRFKRATEFNGKRYWFRHTHATAALEGGMDSIVVAKNMGTSREMLERVYTIPGKGAIERQGEIVRQKYRGLK